VNEPPRDVIEIDVGGERLHFRQGEGAGPEMAQKVARLVNDRIREAQSKAPAAGKLGLVVLAMLDVARENLELKAALEVVEERAQALAESIDRTA